MTAKPELDWKRLRAAVPEADAALALYVHCTGEASAMKLMYAGFDPNQVNRALSGWRREYLLNGNELSAKALLYKFPQLETLLTRIAAGEFTVVQPAPPPVRAAVTQPAVQLEPEAEPEAEQAQLSKEVLIVSEGNEKTKCQRTPGCVREHKHIGKCTTLTPEQRIEQKQERQRRYLAKAKARKTANTSAPKQRPVRKELVQADGKPVVTLPLSALAGMEPTVSTFRFKLEIEEVMSDGERSLYQTSGDSRDKFKRVITAAQTLLNLEGV